MRVPALRCRHTWPADDLVTHVAPVDLAIDGVLRAVAGRRRVLDPRQYGPASTIAVIGFPRSANTTLTSWLTYVALPGVEVVDGRYSHSALDLIRFAQADIPVVVPVRNPVDACGSMLVRQGAHTSIKQARRMLRAYSAWHRAVLPMLNHAGVQAATFEQITEDPASIVTEVPFADLVDADLVLESDVDSVMERTRRELANVIGQGLPENGIASHLMISLPDAGRASELDQARCLLQGDELRHERAKAEDAFRVFIREAGVLPSESAWQLPEHADGQAAGHGRDAGVRVGD